MPGEIHHYRIFRLRLRGDPPERLQNIVLGRLLVLQRHELDALIGFQVLLLLLKLGGEIRGIGHGEAQIELRIGVAVDADGQHVRRTGPLENVGAEHGQRGVLAFHIVAIESVSRESILAGRDLQLRFQRDLV